MTTRVGIIGFGHLGKFLYNQLDESNDYTVVAIWNRTTIIDHAHLYHPLDSLNDANLLKDIDLIIEVAHPSIIADYGVSIVEYCHLFIGSPTALADRDVHQRLAVAAEEHRRCVFVPSGALWGAEDIRKMADMGTLQALKISMTKHPSSFRLLPPLDQLNSRACESDSPTVLYEGCVRDLCKLAPNNVNTMAGAAIAAHNLGFDNVQAKLIADPKLHDWHIVTVDVDGVNGFRCETKRSNPADRGAVTGSLTFYALLASIHRAAVRRRDLTMIGLHIC